MLQMVIISLIAGAAVAGKPLASIAIASDGSMETQRRRHPIATATFLVDAQGESRGIFAELEEEALRLVKHGKNSTDVQMLATQILSMVAPMRTNIFTAHDADEKLLSDLYHPLVDCETARMTSSSKAAALHQTYLAAATTHQNCRVDQEDKGKVLATCQEDFSLTNNTKTSQCRLFDHANKLTRNVQRHQEVIMHRTEDTIGYLLKMKSHFGELKDEYIQKTNDCGDATTAADANAAKCAQYQGVLDDQRRVCDEAQQAMDSGACVYATKSKKTCDDFSACWMPVAHSYDAAKNSTQVHLGDRVGQLQALERIECLLHLAKTGVATNDSIQACNQTSVDVSQLALAYNATPDTTSQDCAVETTLLDLCN